jgi:hypothetical protein
MEPPLENEEENEEEEIEEEKEEYGENLKLISEVTGDIPVLLKFNDPDIK